MTDDFQNVSHTAIASPRITAQPKQSGAVRATLAFLFSLLALAMSGYVLWSGMDAHDGKVVSPLLMEKSTATSDLESRMKAQENAVMVMNDTFKKQIESVQEKLAAQLAPSNEAPRNDAALQELTGATANMQNRLADWERQNAELRLQIKTALLDKSKNIAALALLDHVSRKAQSGLDFQNDLKELDGVIILKDNTAHALNILKGYQEPLSSDAALLAGLHALTPDFLAREKLDKADGIFDKIGIQLQKLVVVRRKNGTVGDETPVGKNLDELQTAIGTNNWAKATAIIVTLSEKKPEALPKDFASWQQKLRDRVLADEAVTTLQRQVLSDLQGVPAKMPEKIDETLQPKLDKAL